MLSLKLLLLLLIANGAPILSSKFFGNRFSIPVDFGVSLKDGFPLFGSSKTFRGLISAVLVVTGFAVILGFEWQTGLLIGVWAMLGDLFSSFVKRRLGMTPSSMALGLDQIPEALFPLIAVSSIVGLTWWQITYLVVLFIVVELVLSRILYTLKIRKKPY